MLGFGKQPANEAAGGDIFDATDATFVTQVIEESRRRPVIVDFWAAGCAPCRTLTPELEKAVTAAGGKIALAKVNIDTDPMIAGQLRVQSIPAVFAFVNGQPIDGFMGALPPSQIKQFIDGVLKAGGGEAVGADIDEAIEAAEAALKDGVIAEAAQTYAAILQTEPTEIRALGGLAKCYTAAGDLDRARQTLAMVPDDKQDDPAIKSARGAVELAEESAGAMAAMAQNRAALETNADNHQARYDLALALAATDDRGGAIEELLEIFRRDRTWNEEAAKQQLMKLFDTFGPTDPLTLSGRRRLSSMIFS